MGAVTPSRRMTREEETRYKSAVSEATAQKLAGSANFINLRQYDVKDFRANGNVSIAICPFLGVDQIYIFPFNCEIINIGIYCEGSGSSGTTEMDVKLSSDNGSTWASIFSTTPKVAAGAGAYVNALSYTIADALTSSPIYQTWTAKSQPSGLTAAVLSGGAPFAVSANDAIRMDLLGVSDLVTGVQLMVYFRPRN